MGAGEQAEGVSRIAKTFKLDLKWEREKTRLARDKPGGGTPMFERWCAIKVLWSALSVEEGYGDLHDSKDTRDTDVLETTEVLENSHTGLFPLTK